MCVYIYVCIYICVYIYIYCDTKWGRSVSVVWWGVHTRMYM